MFIKCIPTGKLFTNCYLVADDEKHGVIIDPGDHPNKLLDEATAEGVQIESIWLTHGHFDHLLAAKEIMETLNIPLYVSHLDEEALNNPELNLLAYMAPNRICELKATDVLHEGDVVYAGTIPFTVWETPGHTPGSLCFVCPQEGILFSGDTLFDGGWGRTDLRGGDELALKHSLNRLFSLSRPYHVYPGHGADFQLGDDHL